MKAKKIGYSLLSIVLSIYMLGSGTALIAAEQLPKAQNTCLRWTETIECTQEQRELLELFWGGKAKTVKKNYQNLADVPAAIFYTEYIDGAWWGGTLELTGSIVRLPNSLLYQATFEGKIYKQ